MPEPQTTAGDAARQQLSPEQLEALAELDPETIRSLGNPGGLATRRDILTGGGVGLLAALLGGYAATEPARAAAQSAGGEGDVGSPSTPFEGFVDGLALVTQDVSSATTVAKPVVRYDPSLSGFTITIDQDLEGPSGYSQPVILQEVGGSSNTVTVNTGSGNGINGGGSITLDQPYATTVLYWTGSEWRTNWITQSVDAGQYNVGGNVMAQSVVATGQVALSGDTGVVDTGESATDATYRVALGVDDPGADVKLSATLFWDDSAGTYKVEITENVGGVNPTVNYDIIRTR